MKKCKFCKKAVSSGVIVDTPKGEVVCCEEKDCLWDMADYISKYREQIFGKQFKNEQ